MLKHLEGTDRIDKVISALSEGNIAAECILKRMDPLDVLSVHELGLRGPNLVEFYRKECDCNLKKFAQRVREGDIPKYYFSPSTLYF